MDVIADTTGGFNDDVGGVLLHKGSFDVCNHSLFIKKSAKVQVFFLVCADRHYSSKTVLLLFNKDFLAVLNDDALVVLAYGLTDKGVTLAGLGGSNLEVLNTGGVRFQFNLRVNHCD